MKTMKKAILALALAGVVALVPASAATITGLFNSGVDNNGVALGQGALDTHYILVNNPQAASTNAFAVIDFQFPFPPWIANSSISRWIGPVADQNANPAMAASTCPG